MIPAGQPRIHERLLEQAQRWHSATEREDCDWQAFTEWLEASPLHAKAYDEAALLEQRIRDHRIALLAIRDVCGAPRRRRLWPAVAALAAVLIAAFLLSVLLPVFRPVPEQTFRALAGPPTPLSLADGLVVVLAPGSTLTVAGRRGERLRLTGEAWFEVPHEARRVLTITAGPFELRDIGTRFEVVNAGRLLKVAVAEGGLDVRLPGRDQLVPVRAGTRLLVAGDPPFAEYGRVAVEDVASWRRGRLVFSNEPLSLVAVELGRHAGVTVTVDSSVAQQRFSGVLAVGEGAQLVSQLARILRLREQRDGAVVHLSPARGTQGR